MAKEQDTTKRVKWYVGVKHTPRGHADIFKTNTRPTRESHGHLYAFCMGGYNTQRKAIQVAMYQNFGIDTPQPERI